MKNAATLHKKEKTRHKAGRPNKLRGGRRSLSEKIEKNFRNKSKKP